MEIRKISDIIEQLIIEIQNDRPDDENIGNYFTIKAVKEELDILLQKKIESIIDERVHN